LNNENSRTDLFDWKMGGTKQTTLKHLCFTSAKILKVLVDFFKQKETW
jgi:hypothetical protein